MPQWRHGLFGCFDNCSLCLITYLVPCYQFGKNAEKVGDGCLFCGIAWLFTGCIAGGILRGKIREQRGIEGGAVGDFLIHLFCPFCAIVQEAQELNSDGSVKGQSMARQ